MTLSEYIADTLLLAVRAGAFSLPAAFLCMFLPLYLTQTERRDRTLREALRSWAAAFRSSAPFRRKFCLCFYTAVVLFVTLLSRTYYPAPLDHVLGEWWFETNPETGLISTRWLLNIFMLLPFTFLLLRAYGDRLLPELSLPAAVWKATAAAGLFSLCIELAQLVLHAGTFQLSDLCYNTLGGLLGSLLAWPFIRKR